MAKNEKVINAPNAKGFHKGENPKKFGPNDDPKAPSGENNKIGGTSEPQEKGNKPGVTDDVLSYRDPSLGGASMPNKKARDVNKGMFNKISDYPTPIGGTPRPNNIN